MSSMGASLTRPARASALRARRHAHRSVQTGTVVLSRRDLSTESSSSTAADVEAGSPAAATSVSASTPLTSSTGSSSSSSSKPSSQSPRRPDWPSATPAPSAALYAMLARLGLPQTPRLEQELRKALTDRSWDAKLVPSLGLNASSDVVDAGKDSEPSNDLLSALGNSLLGLYASEHLATTYPNLPTRALKAALTAYVGPAALASVGRELGLAAGGGGGGTENRAQPSWEEVGGKVWRLKGKDARQQVGGIAAGGVPIRWLRRQVMAEEAEQQDGSATDVAVAESAKNSQDVGEIANATGGNSLTEGASSSSSTTTTGSSSLDSFRSSVRPKRKQDSWEDVMGRATRALVGLIYQEQGMHAARRFTHAHFLSRHLDLAAVLNFRNPKHALAAEVRKMMAESGVQGQSAVQSRLLAESGRHSINPVFNVGLFLPSGLKLAEGHGSSLRMAEHRAAVNALMSIYTVRAELAASSANIQGWLKEHSGDASIGTATPIGLDLPTSVHSDFPLRAGAPAGDASKESSFKGNVTLSRTEALFGSSERSKPWRGTAAKKGVAA